jgi:hypothetical protein
MVRVKPSTEQRLISQKPTERSQLISLRARHAKLPIVCTSAWALNFVSQTFIATNWNNDLPELQVGGEQASTGCMEVQQTLANFWA